MVQLHRRYSVRDEAGRNWGTVSLDHQLGTTLSGRLVPAADFILVAPLFAQFDQLVSQDNVTEDAVKESTERIAVLGVSLRDTETQTEHLVGPVFVSADLLFSCRAA